MEEKEKTRILPGDPKEPHVSSYRSLFGVWVGLIILTVVTVLVSVMGGNLTTLSVLTALVIASAKTIVVGNYFMHLKFDSVVLKIMVGIVIVLFASFTVITVYDYMTR